jgi:hypothetical protein
VTCASSSSLQNERRKSRLNSSIRPWIVLDGDGAIVTLDPGSPPAAWVALRQHAEANLIRTLATSTSGRYGSQAIRFDGRRRTPRW